MKASTAFLTEDAVRQIVREEIARHATAVRAAGTAQINHEIDRLGLLEEARVGGIRASLVQVPARGGIGESRTSLGIDIQTASVAPNAELLRLDVSPDIPLARRFELINESLRLLMPCVVGRRHHVSIDHDFAAGVICVRAIPSHANNIRLHLISLIRKLIPRSIHAQGGAA